eukprot:594618-Prorocentrum_minimum.AAC.1
MLAEAKRAEVEEAKQEAAYRFPKQEASGGLFTCGAQASPSSLPPYVPLTGGGFGCAAPSAAMMRSGAMPMMKSGHGEVYGVVKAMPRAQYSPTESAGYSPTMPAYSPTGPDY